MRIITLPLSICASVYVGYYKGYKNIVVAPCFENNESKSGLDWNTEVRLQAAAFIHRINLPKKTNIVVGGGRLREMKNSFASLMEKFLVELSVPKEDIIKEEYTFDTASQIFWLKNLSDIKGNMGIITDIAQAKHIKSLLRGFKMRDSCEVILMEEVVVDFLAKYDSSVAKENSDFLDSIHKTWEWKKFQIREWIVWLFAQFDRRGWFIGKIAIRRRKVKK